MEEESAPWRGHRPSGLMHRVLLQATASGPIEVHRLIYPITHLVGFRHPRELMTGKELGACLLIGVEPAAYRYRGCIVARYALLPMRQRLIIGYVGRRIPIHEFGSLHRRRQRQIGSASTMMPAREDANRWALNARTPEDCFLLSWMEKQTHQAF